MSVATLNGARVVSVRLVMPYRGVWLADVDIDPELAATFVAQGPAVLVIGEAPGPVATLVGVIDPLASGTFVATARARVVGGAGGWSKDVPAQHFQTDAGVVSTTVYSATGGLVGEVVVDLAPTVLGTDYVRSAGPASRVFDDLSWWVDPTTATTQVGQRPPAVPDTSLELLSWDPNAKRAELTCDALVVPGTPLVDARIGESPVTVRDVEQVFDGAGSRATAFCSTAATSPLLASLGTLVRELAKTAHLKVYRYRVVSAPPGDTSNAKWILQAIGRDAASGEASPMPDLIPADVWTGMSGVLANVAPSLEVLVHFVAGDPTQPVIVGFSTLKLPLALTLDATVEVDVGPSAPLVAIAGGLFPLVVGPWATGLAGALAVFCTTLASSTDATVVSAAGALGSSLGALPPPATTKTKAT